MAVVVPASALSIEALHNLIAEYVTRDGTDYGAEEITLEKKIDAVKQALADGKALIAFDETTQACEIIKHEEWLEWQTVIDSRE